MSLSPDLPGPAPLLAAPVSRATSLFVCGWRPAIGWVCAIGLAFYYWPAFLLGDVLWLRLCLSSGMMQPRPDLGISDVLGLLGSLLGLGTLRTIEKLQGVARSGLGAP